MTGCNFSTKKHTVFQTHILGHMKLNTCDLLLENSCKEEFYNFKDHQRHLEVYHDIDPLGLRMLLEKNKNLNTNK